MWSWRRTGERRASLDSRLKLQAAARAAQAAGQTGKVVQHEQAATEWSLYEWVRGAGVHRIIASALEAAGGADSGSQALVFLKTLSTRSQLEQLVAAKSVTDGIVELLWREVKDF